MVTMRYKISFNDNLHSTLRSAIEHYIEHRNRTKEDPSFYDPEINNAEQLLAKLDGCETEIASWNTFGGSNPWEK